MIALDALTLLLLVASGFFYLGGTLGLLRFPDILTRLHAPAKADTLGLGLRILALVPQAESAAVIAKLVLVWLFTLVMAGCTAYLIARQAQARGDDRPAGRRGA